MPRVTNRSGELLVSKKPHKGYITNWYKMPFDLGPNYGLNYIIRGIFVDHPSFAGERGHTSYVISHNEETGEIETRNSRYTLLGKAIM